MSHPFRAKKSAYKTDREFRYLKEKIDFKFRRFPYRARIFRYYPYRWNKGVVLDITL